MRRIKQYNFVLNEKILREYARLYDESLRALTREEDYNNDKISEIEEWIFNEYLFLVDIAKSTFDVELLSNAFINLYISSERFYDEIMEYFYDTRSLEEKQIQMSEFEHRFKIKYNFAKSLMDSYVTTLSSHNLLF